MSANMLPRIAGPTVTIRVSGKLFEGHLMYLEQLIQTAAECLLWPLLSLACVEELDHAALFYLANGEGRSFSIVSCPTFIREHISREATRAVA